MHFHEIFPYNPWRSGYIDFCYYGSPFYSVSPEEGANHDTIAVFRSFSGRVLRGFLARATVRAAGRRLLPIEAVAEDRDVGLLRRKNATRASDQVRRHCGNSDADHRKPRAFRER